MPTGQGVTKVAGCDSLRWDWLPATPRCSTIPCITSGGGGSVGARGRGDGRGGRAGGAGGRRGTLCRPGAALSRSLRALRVAHARLPGRRGRCGAGRAGAGVRSAGGLPRAGQVCGVAVPDFAEPLLRGAAPPAATGTAARFDGRDVCGARPAGRRVRASGARPRIGAGAAAPDPGAARGLRAEAHGRIGVRGDRRGHGRDGGLAQDADASRVRPAAGADEGASMMASYHPLVKRLLDGEVSLAELPPELQAEGEEALRLVGAADRALQSSCGSCYTRRGREVSRSRARSISGTGAPRPSSPPGRAACGPPPSPSPSASINTRSSWTGPAGSWIRPRLRWTTASAVVTAWSQ